MVWLSLVEPATAAEGTVADRPELWTEPDDLQYLAEARLQCSRCGELACSALHLCHIQTIASNRDDCMNLCDDCLLKITGASRCITWFERAQ